MKRTILFLLVAATFTACNNSGDKKPADTKVESATETKMDYAYTIENPDQWETGSKENTKMVLQSLKDYENGNIEATLTAFADSVQLNFDGFEGKFSKDSVRKMFTAQRNMSKTLTIKMDDFESVRSKDGKAEYVSLWYKEIWQDQKGAWDSLSVMDDLRIKDGKITSIDQKIRHFAKKKM